jgi:hypothetical protein
MFKPCSRAWMNTEIVSRVLMSAVVSKMMDNKTWKRYERSSRLQKGRTR